MTILQQSCALKYHVRQESCARKYFCSSGHSCQYAARPCLDREAEDGGGLHEAKARGDEAATTSAREAEGARKGGGEGAEQATHPNLERQPLGGAERPLEHAQ